MKPIHALVFTLPLFILSCAPSPGETARANFKGRPIDNRSKDLRLEGNHHGIGQVDVPPKFAGPGMAPEYPKELLKLGGQGAVQIVIVIDAKGNVAQTETIYADDQLFADAVKAAAKTWKFIPAKKGGKDVSAWGILPVQFRIKKPLPPYIGPLLLR